MSIGVWVLKEEQRKQTTIVYGRRGERNKEHALTCTFFPFLRFQSEQTDITLPPLLSFSLSRCSIQQALAPKYIMQTQKDSRYVMYWEEDTKKRDEQETAWERRVVKQVRNKTA